MKDKFAMKFYYTDLYLKAQLYIESIFFVITAIISVFLFKWNVLMYIPAFIVSELLFLTFREFISVVWNLFFWQTLSLEEKREKLSDILYSLGGYYPDTNLMCDISTEVEYILKEYDKKLASLIIEQEKNLDEYNPELKSFIKINNDLKAKINSNSYLSIDDNFVLLNNLYNNLDKIIELIKEKPAMSTFSNKIFNIYIPEILVLINDIPKGDETVSYVKNLIKVIEEINKLSNTTIETMIEFNKKSTDISFNVLIKEIQKTEEELHG